eukprot:TRINITY_DN13928_c0_g2_i1.p1 TRINITY_DN13928_c0_g2~~TRINITY_DN13928_c0_g2_i1.p1  ORF type:complete len:208 (-),score=23.79 TRINITY_DN13928_c0_g2_i1:55-654(-)
MEISGVGAEATLQAFLAERPDIFGYLRDRLHSALTKLSKSELSPHLREHIHTVLAALSSVTIRSGTAFEVRRVKDEFFRDKQGKQVRDVDYGYVELLGPDAPSECHHSKVRLGLSFQGPSLCYRGHYHEAQEFYVVLGGASLWWTGSVPQWEYRELSWHGCNEHHAMNTADRPAVYFWSWTGNITHDVNHSLPEVQAKL